MLIRKSKKPDFAAVMKLARKMWPDIKPGDLRPRYCFYIAEEDKRIVGFVLLNIRHDYVPGSTTFPVGYVEGIYVEPKWRKAGVGRMLIEAAEQWTIDKGMSELGSDVKPRNRKSQRFHTKVGFRKEELVVPYIKKVRPR